MINPLLPEGLREQNSDKKGQMPQDMINEMCHKYRPQQFQRDYSVQKKAR